jgi:transposase InsO family protein
LVTLIQRLYARGARLYKAYIEAELSKRTYRRWYRVGCEQADFTYLASVVKGQFYYLYLFEGIYSRKIVGYEVHEQECGESAAELIHRSMLREQRFKQPLVLHSDNGAPMKSQTVKAKLEELGVTASLSCPYLASLFKSTLSHQSADDVIYAA